MGEEREQRERERRGTGHESERKKRASAPNEGIVSRRDPNGGAKVEEFGEKEKEHRTEFKHTLAARGE